MLFFRSNGFAEKLFQSLEPKTPEAYNALICGMANYGQVDRALEYYNQMTSNADSFLSKLKLFVYSLICSFDSS